MKHKTLGMILAIAGLAFFGFGLYILPFGTDAYMYFWVMMVFHGNWLYGDIAANGAAIFMILLGLLLMRKAGKKAELKDIVPVEKKKTRKKKSSRSSKKGGGKWLRL